LVVMADHGRIVSSSELPATRKDENHSTPPSQRTRKIVPLQSL
jgi:hypothetical protein